MTKSELYLKYLLVWPGLRELGDPARIDCLLAFAFSQNDIPDAERCRIGLAYRHFAYRDLETLAALRYWQLELGQPTNELAAAVQTQLNSRLIPAIVPWEIALALPMDWFIKNRSRLHVVWPSPQEHARFSIRDMIVGAKPMLEKLHARNVQILAHQRVIVRMVLAAQREGLTPIVTGEPVDSFNPKAVLSAIHGPWSWIPRETLMRLIFLQQGWV